MKEITEIFGSLVFNDTVMKHRLPEDTYLALKKTIANGETLNIEIANTVAAAMKDWAIEKGATHFTHWFQPMTGVTAEKHDSFIKPVAGSCKVIMEFSGKALVQGEPDASSFPSGGLRATFEARGYTAWDPTSYAFIKDGSLCIPSVFLSYTGAALDKKTPLLRSMQALEKQALRILKLFGNTDAKRVLATVGAEQEYFLIDKSVFNKREDLAVCGRTLFGAKPPKGQELNDHYFGAIKPRVSEFMKDLDEELWKVGVPSKTKHNEAAPAQHELAPVFETVNLASDHNQLTMAYMKDIALKHGMVCLLHEKPFDGINGSGKHDNWSICTDTGINLLEPGETPYENAQFLLFLVAVIKAVDKYQDLLRVTAASAGNDCRLGSNEAPPAIISIFLGDELNEILDAVEKGSIYKGKAKKEVEIGVTALPHFPKDTTDRNRTSPMAFTGNKFEFRMLGSNFSIAGPNIVLNTAVAEILRTFADKLESSENFQETLSKLIKRTIKDHKRIIFNGNNYSDEWIKEAESRGLYNLKNTVEALPRYIAPENIELMEKHGVFTRTEMYSRYEILLENYSKITNIEGLTMCDMVKKEIIPSVLDFIKELSVIIKNKKEIEENIDCTVELKLIKETSSLNTRLYNSLNKLEEYLASADKGDSYATAEYYSATVKPEMDNMRKITDSLEVLLPKSCWPYPTYTEILNSI